MGASAACKALPLGSIVLGQRINNFEVVRLLGEGGMGAVYEAEHLLIRRRVAVKVLKPERAVDAELVERFFNEARATSAIRHPNIVEVLDVGMLAEGVPYLVMELLEGESLAERLHRLGALDIDSALDVVQQAASALVAAHGAGIVHRDLKPENLFLVRDERFAERELVKVLDFGIAKLRADMTSLQTMPGAVIGTPPYMSPEQCRGLPFELDERTDIYALGIILYEALCGAPPFTSRGVGEIMLAHMTIEPEPPSRHCPELPPRLERIMLKALAKRREDRFSSMAEFYDALTRYVDYASISAFAPTASGPPPETLSHGAMGGAGNRDSADHVLAHAPTQTAGPGAILVSTPPRDWRSQRAVWAGALALLALVCFWFWPRAAPGKSSSSVSSARMPGADAHVAAPPPMAALARAEPSVAQPQPPPTAANAASSPPPSVAGAIAHGSHAPAPRPLRKKAQGAVASQPPAAASPPAPPPAPANASSSEASKGVSAPGYLSLDSSPWSDVFLGSTNLGTTPILRVPLPPGRHLLTLKNSELGTSTSYMVEIQSGKTISRLVGWEK